MKFSRFFNGAVAGFLVATDILVIAGTLSLLASSFRPCARFPVITSPRAVEYIPSSVQLCHSCLTAASMLLVTLLLLAYLQLLVVLLQLAVLQMLAVLNAGSFAAVDVIAALGILTAAGILAFSS